MNVKNIDETNISAIRGLYECLKRIYHNQNHDFLRKC